MDHTILVVDDEPANLRALQRTLSGYYQVLAANSGQSGLDLLERHRVSLIVTDHRMPGITGVEMLSHSRRSHPQVVRIVLTGYADVDALIDAINDGAVFYYLTKPWEPHELLLAVRRGLEHLEAERQRQALLREVEEALARVQREAEQKTRLLTTAAHELGTPVHLLGNALDLLADDPAAGAREWLGIAGRNLAWLQRSLAQMHTGVRLRSSQVRLVARLLALRPSLAEVLRAIDRAASERRLAFSFDVAPELRVHGDPTWLRQAWICLLSNAVRFTPDGGRVSVGAGPEGAGVRVWFADTGVGMSPAQLDGVFEAFSTSAGDLLLHGSGRFEFGARGMGLGLSIAKELVDLHCGRIALESEPGRGTRVNVWLPGP